jgi:hypothetical protein
MLSLTGIFISSLKWDEDRWDGFRVELTASETQKCNAKEDILMRCSRSLLVNKYNALN